MIAVIQCARSKDDSAGYMRGADGRRILFVGNPVKVPANQMDASISYAHPDEMMETGRSWREELVRYNVDPESNPWGLLPAWRLYSNEVYALLEERFGADRLFILSAGWGLIRADFMTPRYDITFSTEAACYKRRRKNDRFEDINMLPPDTRECILFFVEADYVPLARRLTSGIRSTRHLFHESGYVPDAADFVLESYDMKTEGRWHYACAKDWLEGKIKLSPRSFSR